MRNVLKKGDILARNGNRHRRYEVMEITRLSTPPGFAVTVKFLGNYYADGRVEGPAHQWKRKLIRDILVETEETKCPIPKQYELVEEANG